MFSSPDYNSPMVDSEVNIHSVLDTITSCLNLCKHEYKEKEKENLAILDKLGFNINDLSENMKQDLRNLFNDDEVTSIEYYGKKELVIMNAQQLQESLAVDDELVEVELLVKEADAFLKKAEETHCLLQRQLDTAKVHSKYIDDKCNDKAVKELIFQKQIEKKEHELNVLHKITEELERPKFSWEEVESLQAEEKKLQEELIVLEAKLAKYNNLPLDEKAAAQLLVQLKEEVLKVENEIKLQLNDLK